MGNLISVQVDPRLTKGILALSAVIFLAGGYVFMKNRSNKSTKSEQVDEDTLDLEKELLNKSPRIQRQKSIYDKEHDSDDDPLILIRTMPVEKDQEGILTEQALVNLFDKRNTIRGVRKKAKEFRNK